MENTLSIQEAGTVEETAALMRERIGAFVPEVEILLKAELAFKINQLKRELNAVILGHNYMEPALYYAVTDYTGDSLELSRISAQTDADIIVFCGVRFMAETAKILNPQKTVLLPSDKAGCSLAEGVSAADIRALRKQYPQAMVVTYVNTYADVKAESDYCCTSGNAAKVVQHLLDEGHKHVLFLPDEYLARNTARELGLPFYVGAPDSEGHYVDVPLDTPAIIGWNVRCEVHDLFTPEDVRSVRKQFPGALVIAHPEVSPEVLAECDKSGSTKQMVEYVQTMDADQYMLFTECTMGDNIAAENPDKEMIRLCSHRCPYMGQITLEDTLAGLEQMRYQIELPADIIERARMPIDRMLMIR